MLGMELQGISEEDYKVLFQLIESALVTVIEFSSSWTPCLEQFNYIRENTNSRIAFSSKLELSGNEVGDLEYSWLPRYDRMIYVLQPG